MKKYIVNDLPNQTLTGNLEMTGNLTVDGDQTLAGNLEMTGNLAVDGEFAVTTRTFGSVHQWTFGSDGNLTAPTASSIETGYAGFSIVSDSGLSSPDPGDLLNGALYVSFGQVSISYNQESSMGGPESRYQWDFNSTSGSLQLPTTGGGIEFGDGTTQSTAWKGGIRVVDIPNSSVGTTGDMAGDVAFSPNHIFYCFQNFAGTVINMTSITNGGMTRSFLIMYDSAYGFTDADLTGYTVTGPGGYSGSVTGSSQPQGGGQWYIPVSPDVYQEPGTYIFTSPSGNIWKRLAWSNDTW